MVPIRGEEGKNQKRFSFDNMAALPNVRARQDMPPKGGYPEVSILKMNYAILSDIGRVS